ncbi:hypothetical protein BCAR13_820011 [Paraburkholderia caribensis]|nr:hypothetical protein BCAR13_820011 [Paraburkholderia caribensis]
MVSTFSGRRIACKILWTPRDMQTSTYCTRAQSFAKVIGQMSTATRHLSRPIA